MHKPRLSLLLVAAWTLSACQVPVGTAGNKPKPTASTGAGKGGATEQAMLAKPDGASTMLAGKVEIDAHYLLGTGKGKLLGAAASNVIAVNGGSLLGAAASNLIGAAASNLIGAAGSNLIGKRKFDLLATTAATSTLEVGKTLPAAEMEIMVYDLIDGQPLVLGQDKDGKDVVSIYTNAAGAYTVYLPATLSAKNVRVVARVPDTKDTRLEYPLVTTFTASSTAEINEDTAIASAFLREAFVSRMERYFLDSQAKGGLADSLPPQAAALAGTLLKDLDQAIADGKAGNLPADQRKELARRTADKLLARVAITELMLPDGSAETMPTLVKLLREFREAATTKMKADANYFQTQDFLVQANAALADDVDYVIKKPADLNDFVLRYLLTSTDREMVSKGISAMLKAVDLPDDRKLTANACMESLIRQIAMTLLTDSEAKADVVATIRKGL